LEIHRQKTANFNTPELTGDNTNMDDTVSIQTSSTERHQLANQAVNVKMNERRYIALSKITDEEINMRMPKKTQLKAQVSKICFMTHVS
jgi:hypothetical protein